MVSAQLNLIRKIVGVIGNAIALCLFLSPTPTFVRIVKKKSVEKYSPMPYLATLINCLVRALYGLPMIQPRQHISSNNKWYRYIVIEIVFLTIFFIFCGRQKQRLVISAVLAVEVVFVAILAVLVLTLEHSTDQRTASVGIVFCVFNTMMYASPLSVMKMVIKTKILEFMPLLLSVAGFLNAGVWTIYGFVPFDTFMAIPNGIGCVFGLAQLILYATYYKSTKKIMAERQRSITRIEAENISYFNQRVSGV